VGIDLLTSTPCKGVTRDCVMTVFVMTVFKLSWFTFWSGILENSCESNRSIHLIQVSLAFTSEPLLRRPCQHSDTMDSERAYLAEINTGRIEEGRGG